MLAYPKKITDYYKIIDGGLMLPKNEPLRIREMKHEHGLGWFQINTMVYDERFDQLHCNYEQPLTLQGIMELAKKFDAEIVEGY